MLVSRKDKAIIRDLAKTQLEYANSEKMAQLKKEWIRHNDCVPGRPMVTIEWETFKQEALFPLLKTKGIIAREIEKIILGNYLGQMLFEDDSIVKNYIGIPKQSGFVPFGLKKEVQNIKDGLGHHFVAKIKDLEEDFDKLKKSKYKTHFIGNGLMKAYIKGLVGDILPVKYVGRSLYAVPTQDIVHIMDLETMMLSMYDYPTQFHTMMEKLSSDYIEYFEHLQEKKFLLPTNDSEWVGQGSYAFTTQLKGEQELKGKTVKTTDVWGFMDSQETSSISPEMYEEFIFPYYAKIAKVFGLLSYGCCEPVDGIWDNCLSKLENLRKLSISAWCNEDVMGEKLQGTYVIYHRKPSANFIGVDKHLDTEAFKSSINKTLNCARGCNIEFTQRDVYTVHNDMNKVRNYVKIIRELSNN